MSTEKLEAISAECLNELRGMIPLPEANHLKIILIKSLFSLAYAEGNADGFREAVIARDEESQPGEYK
tara:strand:+ start:522 stop:725 length:204 start_codon:yes stop_codon:yes gene_type:complete